MALLKLDIHPLYRRAMATPIPSKFFALSVARWLRKVTRTLEERGYCFESGSAEELAGLFEKEAERDGSIECLADLWLELEDWGDTSVTLISGREVSLCVIPHLPDPLT